MSKDFAIEKEFMENWTLAVEVLVIWLNGHSMISQFEGKASKFYPWDFGLRGNIVSPLWPGKAGREYKVSSTL